MCACRLGLRVVFVLFPLGIGNLNGQFVETVQPPGFLQHWGSSGSGVGQFAAPRGVALDIRGNAYITDTNNHRIQKFDSHGNFWTYWGASGSDDGQFSYPTGVAIDASGQVYVADTFNHRVQKFDSAGNFLSSWGSSGSGDGQFAYPWGVAVDASGNVYVADKDNHRIQKFDSAGNFLTKWGSSGSSSGQFSSPAGVAADAFGNVYVADHNNHRIQKFDSFGVFLTSWGAWPLGSSGSGYGQFNYPWGVAVDLSGNVYVGDQNNHRIQKFDSRGYFLTSWGSNGTDPGQFDSPHGVAVDSFGKVYVVDSTNSRIQKFAPVREFLVEGDDARILVRNTSPTGPTPAPPLPGTQFAAIDDATGGYFSVIDGKDAAYFPLFWFSGVGTNGNGGGFVSELPVANDVYSGNEKAAVVLEGRRSDATNLVNTNLLAVRNKWTPALWLTAGGNLYTTGSITPGSSRELKEQIERLELEDAVEVLAGLDPVTFRYKQDREKDLKVGFIAEDVPDLVATPDRKGVSAMDIVGILTRVVQEQQRVVQDQQSALQTQQNKISRLEAELTEVKDLKAELARIQVLLADR